LCILRCVIICYTQQNDETFLDFADNLFLDFDAGARNALNNSSHLPFGIP
jgi:hypothetical protein